MNTLTTLSRGAHFRALMGGSCAVLVRTGLILMCAVLMLCGCSGTKLESSRPIFDAPKSQRPVLVTHTGISGNNGPSTAQLSPNGDLLALVSEYHVALLDARTGYKLRDLGTKDDTSYSVCFSADGHQLAVGGRDYIALYDTTDFDQLQRFDLDVQHDVERVLYLPDRETLVADLGDNELGMVNIESGEIKKWQVHDESIRGIAVADDGDIVTSDGQQIRVWKGESKQLQIDTDHLTFWLAGNGLICTQACCTHSLMFWDKSTGKLLNTVPLKADEGFDILTSNHDGSMLVSTTSGGELVIRNSNGMPISRIKNDRGGQLYAVSFSNEGSIGACEQGGINIWNLKTGQKSLSLRQHVHPITSIAFSPDGDRLAIAGEDKKIKLWDFHNGTLVAEPQAHDETIDALAFSPEGQDFASTSSDGKTVLWHSSKPHELLKVKKQDASFLPQAGAPCSISFSPDGTCVAAGSNAVFTAWDVAQGNPIFSVHHKVDQYSSLTTNVAVSPNWKLMCTLPDQGVAKEITKGPMTSGYTSRDATVSDFDTKRILYTIPDTGYSFESALFSPDSNIIAFKHDNNDMVFNDDENRTETHDRISLFDARTGHVRVSLDDTEDASTVEDSFVTSLSFSPDSKLIAAGYQSGVVDIWSTANGHRLVRLKPHTNSVTSLAFAPSGEILGAAGRDGSIKFYSMSARMELCTFVPLDTSDWVAYDAEGKFDASPNGFGCIHGMVGDRHVNINELKGKYLQPGLMNRVAMQ